MCDILGVSFVFIYGRQKPAGKKEGVELVIAVDLYKKAIDGDPDAIEKICLDTWQPLYRFIYYKVQNREEAEDITQETYVKTLSTFKKATIPLEKFLAFMKTVSLNVMRDRWRQKKRLRVSVNFQEINPEEAALKTKKMILRSD